LPARRVRSRRDLKRAAKAVSAAAHIRLFGTDSSKK
jgi:hypothetical protein